MQPRRRAPTPLFILVPHIPLLSYMPESAGKRAREKWRWSGFYGLKPPNTPHNKKREPL
jgi:hypothetical protein